jgi:hypothetical protein
MSDQAFVNEEIVDSNILDPNNIKCPKCKSDTLLLVGQSQVPQRNIMENGIITKEMPGEYEDGSFDLEEINCLTCNTKFIVHSHDLFRLEKENLELARRAGIKDSINKYVN